MGSKLPQCFDYKDKKVMFEELGSGNIKLSINGSHEMYLFCMKSSKKNTRYCYDSKNSGIIEYNSKSLIVNKPVILTSVEDSKKDITIKFEEMIKLKNCAQELASR
jgi:hypothetical protein